MLITPLPGTRREDILRTLREMQTAVENAYSSHQGNAQAKLGAYLEWATLAVTHLSSQISAADMDRLVLTPAYGRLLAGLGTVTGTDTVTQRALNGLV